VALELPRKGDLGRWRPSIGGGFVVALEIIVAADHVQHDPRGAQGPCGLRPLVAATKSSVLLVKRRRRRRALRQASHFLSFSAEPAVVDDPRARRRPWRALGMATVPIARTEPPWTSQGLAGGRGGPALERLLCQNREKTSRGSPAASDHGEAGPAPAGSGFSWAPGNTRHSRPPTTSGHGPFVAPAFQAPERRGPERGPLRRRFRAPECLVAPLRRRIVCPGVCAHVRRRLTSRPARRPFTQHFALGRFAAGGRGSGTSISGPPGAGGNRDHGDLCRQCGHRDPVPRGAEAVVLVNDPGPCDKPPPRPLFFRDFSAEASDARPSDDDDRPKKKIVHDIGRISRSSRSRSCTRRIAPAQGRRSPGSRADIQPAKQGLAQPSADQFLQEVGNRAGGAGIRETSIPSEKNLKTLKSLLSFLESFTLASIFWTLSGSWSTLFDASLLKLRAAGNGGSFFACFLLRASFFFGRPPLR